MVDPLDLLAPLTEGPIVSAGMTDAETDWIEPPRCHATKSDPDGGPSAGDLVSTPRGVVYNDVPAMEVFNAGYGVPRQGEESVDLDDVAAAVAGAGPDQVAGIVSTTPVSPTGTSKGSSGSSPTAAHRRAP